MAKVLGVGNATLDIINHVEDFPQEDAEIRAIRQEQRRGGNVTNSMVVLSQLGYRCTWAGTLADDSGSEIIRNDLGRYSINIDPVRIIPGGHVPTSYITLNQQNGSRTIVHYRDLVEYSLEDFRRIDLTAFDWLHFEGRNIEQTQLMLEYAIKTAPDIPRSLEVEKPRNGIGAVCSLADLLLYSRSFVEQTMYKKHLPEIAISIPAGAKESAENFLLTQYQLVSTADHICTWGDSGVFGIDRSGKHYHVPATGIKVVDTVGAGDVFTAGILHGRLNGMDFEACLHSASQLAARSCAQYGLEGLID